MKKRLQLSIIIPILLVSIISCSSFESWVRSSLEDKPIWVYEPQVARDQIAFVGTGEAQNSTLAELRSYESILEQISQYIGKDVSKEFITELSQRGGIERYQLKITRRFMRKNESGELVHLLAVADKSLIDSDRSDLSLEIEKKSNEIKELQSKAALLLREDKDIDAATLYIKIASIASTIVSESGSQYYKDATKRLFSILDKITITYEQEFSNSTSHFFQARRGSRSLATKIAHLPLKVSFMAQNVDENEYVDTKTILTDKNGRALFVNTNPSMVSSGEMNVELDISPFEPYYASLSIQERERIQTIVDSSSIRIPYTRKLSINTDIVLLSIGEYSLKGELLDSSYIEDVVSSSLRKRGIVATRIAQTTLETQELLSILQNRYKGATLFYGKSGISSIHETREGYAVVVRGEITLYTLQDQITQKTIHEVRSVGKGASIQEATQNAFEQGGTISVSLLNRLLYSSP